MKLIITFSSKDEKRVAPPAPPPLPVPLDGETCKDGGKIDGVFWPSDLVSARLEDYGGLIVDQKYRLQLAANHASGIEMVCDEKGKFEYEKRIYDKQTQKKRKQYIKEVDLFWGAAGKSFLVLSDAETDKEIIYWQIRIMPPPWQMDMWNKMLRELLPFASPYVVSRHAATPP